MELIIVSILIVVGFLVGSHNEKKHYKSIALREGKYLHLPMVPMKSIPMDETIQSSKLVTGSVVISIDHFKRLLAGFRSIFGGNVSSYETLLDRARREAILRMKEEASLADAIYNLKVETSSVSKTSQKGTVGSIEVLAYGTALYYKK